MNLGYVGCVARAKTGEDRWNTQRSESGWPNMGVASIRSPKSLLGDSLPESLARLMLVELEVQMAGSRPNRKLGLCDNLRRDQV